MSAKDTRNCGPILNHNDLLLTTCGSSANGKSGNMSGTTSVQASVEPGNSRSASTTDSSRFSSSTLPILNWRPPGLVLRSEPEIGPNSFRASFRRRRTLPHVVFMETKYHDLLVKTSTSPAKALLQAPLPGMTRAVVPSRERAEAVVHAPLQPRQFDETTRSHVTPAGCRCPSPGASCLTASRPRSVAASGWRAACAASSLPLRASCSPSGDCTDGMLSRS